jgi:hypothetical protein
MDTKSATFVAVVAANLTLGPIPFTARQKDEQLGKKEREVAQVDQKTEQSKNRPESIAAIATPQPAADSGQKPAGPPDENVAIQREIAALTRTLAQDTHRSANYTLVLVVIGGIVGGLQIALLFYQNRYTGRAATAALKSAEASLRGTRAYLTIDGWSMTGFEPNGVVYVKYKLANSGQTPAKILESLQRIGLLETLPATPEYTDAFPDGQFEIAAGDSMTKHLNTKRRLDPAAHKAVADGTLFLYVWGFTRYQDVFGKIHTKRFGWVYDREITSFRWVDNPAYNAVTDDA